MNKKSLRYKGKTQKLIVCAVNIVQIKIFMLTLIKNIFLKMGKYLMIPNAPNYVLICVNLHKYLNILIFFPYFH